MHKKTPKGRASEVYFRQQESKVERHDMSLLCRYVIMRSTVWLDDYFVSNSSRYFTIFSRIW